MTPGLVQGMLEVAPPTGRCPGRDAPYPDPDKTTPPKVVLVVLEQLIQIVGALLVLTGFVLAQMRRLDQSSVAYLALNLVGSLVLAWLAFAHRDYGFLLLEAVWALVSAFGLAAVLRGRAPAPQH